MRVLILLLFFISCHSLSSQDLLTTKDGQILEVKIQKIDEDIIQYYRYTDDSKILFKVEKAAFTKIELVDFVPDSSNPSIIEKDNKDPRHFIVNGEKGYGFNDLRPFLKSNDSALANFEMYKSQKATAKGLGAFTLLTMSAGAVTAIKGQNTDNLSDGIGLSLVLYGSIIGTAVFGTMALLVDSSANKYKEKTLEAYGISSLYKKQNKTFENPKLKIGLVTSGVGIQINF